MVINNKTIFVLIPRYKYVRNKYLRSYLRINIPYFGTLTIHINTLLVVTFEGINIYMMM